MGGLHTAVAGFVLMASFTGLGARRGDGLGLLFVLGLGANLLLYLYLLPFAVPTYPSLTSSAFTTLLITGAVLFSWSMRRTILVGVLVCAGFALVGVALGRRGFPMPPFVGPLSWIAIGAALAVACARVLGRFRTSLIQRQDELAALSTRLISVQEEQLRRLSRELHDELGQSLTAVSSYLWLLERKLPPDLGELRARAGEARRLVAKTLGEMRELSQLLRPPGRDRAHRHPRARARAPRDGHAVLGAGRRCLPARQPAAAARECRRARGRRGEVVDSPGAGRESLSDIAPAQGDGKAHGIFIG